MSSSDVTANGLADVVGLPRCPLNATKTLRMIENLIRVLMWFITDAYSSFVFFESISQSSVVCSSLWAQSSKCDIHLTMENRDQTSRI